MDGGGSNVKKSITIDSASLSGSGMLKGKRTKRDKTARKIRPSSIVQPSVLKKTLLERIKQHQKTREQTRSKDSESDSHHQIITDSSNDDKKVGDESFTTNFTKSMDFLQKLALKRQQLNKTRRNNTTTNSSFTSSAISNASNVKTPEAKMLNKVAETLTSGEIITNTGVVGLPVNIYKESEVFNMNATATTSPPVMNIMPSHAFPVSYSNPNIHITTTPSSQMPLSSLPSQINTNITPSISDLATIYNNTIAASNSDSTNNTDNTNTNTNTNTSSLSSSDPNDQPIHVPEDPESFLPSIFIKEEPPHGCLKQGKKPTFREWANKMLKKPVDTIKNMFGGTSGEGPDGSNDGASSRSNLQSSNSSNSFVNNQQIDPENIEGMRVKIRKTLKKKFRVGKHDNVVGVLLKNKESQRHIQKQHLTLKNKSIGEIRKHLYDKNLLKIGSNAPPDVVRRLYEDSILTGDVKNTGGDVLIHNFFSNE